MLDGKTEGGGADDNRVRQVTVVGGGTAGWLSALALTSFLNRFNEGPPIRVSVIESPKIPTVGVGEATVTGITRLMRQLGLNESEFFKRCNASFKLSVRFADWARHDDGSPKVFMHPFNYPGMLEGHAPAYHFHKYGPHPGTVDFADSLVVNSALVRERRGPRRIGDKDYEAAIGYSYHLDAGLFAGFLRDVAVERGLNHIRDDVVDVELDERGFVSALQLEEGGRYPVEFVIDCTGFRGLILQKALGEPFLSYSDHLLCDSAIPVQIPHRDASMIEPCTRSTALGAGWVWRVPLYSRVGTGYVFSSQYRSDDEARAEFFGHLRENGDLPADAPDPETRVIRMRVGRTRRAWVKNCVGIGLSGGFVEPLESTAIYTIEMAARWLVNYFPERDMNPVLADSYNAIIAALYEEVRDFISSHYLTSNRTEPFWQAARGPDVLSDSLRGKLELWRHTLPSMLDTRASTLFNYWSYLYTLWPKGHFADKPYPLSAVISRPAWERHGKALASEKQRLLTLLPNHYELLSHIRGEAPAPDRAKEGFNISLGPSGWSGGQGYGTAG